MIRGFTTLARDAFLPNGGRVEDCRVQRRVDGVEACRGIDGLVEAKVHIIIVNGAPHEFPVSLLNNIPVAGELLETKRFDIFDIEHERFINVPRLKP